jgi:DNA recombination protein RmuC
VGQALQANAAATSQSVSDISRLSLERVDAFGAALTKRVTELETRSTEALDQSRRELVASAETSRDRVTAALTDATASQAGRLAEFATLQEQQWHGFRSQIDTLRIGVETKVESLRTAVEQRLRDRQQDNATKLDQMRHTVDEKLQSTLETRLGESFRQVSERLEQVYKGLGEMQVLATGVGDLKRVLSNVKTRGTWGEVQLGTLLEQVLAPDQYAASVPTNDTGGERVEFAIRLPGRSGKDDQPAWLPIDAKFPMEDYQALVDATDRADIAAVDEAGRRLEARVKGCAKDILTKYVNPPKTTDFAIMFLPNEGLYAEVLRRPGLGEQLQRDYRIVIAGPTTLWAILNSLQMGFRTLAIQRRSSEVWSLLGAVKTEFGKFGTVLDRIQKNLNTAASKIAEARKNTRVIERKLSEVQELPSADALALLDGVLIDPEPALPLAG